MDVLQRACANIGGGSARVANTGPWLMVAVLGLAGLCASSSVAVAQGVLLGDYRIELRANPMRLPADGRTPCRIQAEVRRLDGSVAPDGTRVVFNTDLGWLGVTESERRATVTATTRGGATVVFLRSDAPGIATVYARIQETRTYVRVTFLEPGAAARGEGVPERPARSVTVSGEWVGYCADTNMVEARGRSRVKYGSLVIDVGDQALLAADTLKLRATNCVIRKGEYEVEAAALVADLLAGEIMVQRLVEGTVLRQRLSLGTLEPIPDAEPIPAGTFRHESAEGDIWFVASSVRIFPGERVVVRGGTMYSGLQKVLSLPPYWIIAMPGYTGASNSSMLGVNSSGDLAVDIPFFFQVTDTWTGAVKLQRGATMGGVSARSGWTIALQEEYATASGARGAFVLGGLPRKDWGVSWRDSRRMLGGFDVFTDLSLPDHRSLYFNTLAYTTRDRYRFSFRTSCDRPAGYPGSLYAAAEWLTHPRPVGNSSHARYSFGTAISFARAAGMDEGRDWRVMQEFYSALDFAPYRLSGSWSLAPRIENVFAWYSTGGTSNSARGELSLAGRLGRTADLRLAYSVEHASGCLFYTGWRQALDLYLTAHYRRWGSYLSASRDLTDGAELATLATDYRLSDKWRLGALLTYYRFGPETFEDIEVTVGRALFGQEIGLRWSASTGRFGLSVLGFSRAF